MDLTSIAGFFAQAEPQRVPQAWTQLVFLAPMIIIIVVMFMSQGKKAKQHAELLKTLRSGDRVLTSSGILGTVVAVREKSITLRTADAKLELIKSAVTEITERGADKSDSQTES